MNNSNQPSVGRLAALSNICDAKLFVSLVEQCLEESQSEKLRPHHLANFMALIPELFITHYDSISEAFVRNNGLEITFKLKLAPEKDTAEISFKPVDTYKDSASADLPNEDQEEFDFQPTKPARRGAGRSAV